MIGTGNNWSNPVIEGPRQSGLSKRTPPMSLYELFQLCGVISTALQILLIICEVYRIRKENKGSKRGQNPPLPPDTAFQEVLLTPTSKYSIVTQLRPIL